MTSLRTSRNAWNDSALLARNDKNTLETQSPNSPGALLLILLGSRILFAQVDVASSTVKGKVTDQFAAAISGATITITSSERGVTRNVVTGDEGAYQVPVLQPVIYELRVAASGFQSQVLRGLHLTIGQVVVHDFKLEIGQLSAEVSADARPTLIETTRTQQSDTIERNQLANLPNLSHNFSAYVFTLSGVADTDAPRFGLKFEI